MKIINDAYVTTTEFEYLVAILKFYIYMNDCNGETKYVSILFKIVFSIPSSISIFPLKIHRRRRSLFTRTGSWTSQSIVRIHLLTWALRGREFCDSLRYQTLIQSAARSTENPSRKVRKAPPHFASPNHSTRFPSGITTAPFHNCTT